MSGVIQQFPVEKEYEKNPNISPEDIRKLREWMRTQPHLPEQHWTDLDLIITYHSCDNSPEVTKQVIDLHITARTLFTNFFKDRVVDKKLIEIMKVCLLTPLATPTAHGYRALYCRLLDGDTRKFIFSDIIRVVMMVFDLWQYAEGTWPGFVIIIDMDMATLGHIAKLDVMTIRQTLYFLQECMLVKLKGVHFLNAPSFMDKLMMLLKPFMKDSLLSIIQIHESNSQELFKYVPKEALPKDCGGSYEDLKTLRDEQIDRFENNKEFFKQENLRRINETLRQNGKKKTIEDIFGIQGSFKKLDID